MTAHDERENQSAARAHQSNFKTPTAIQPMHKPHSHHEHPAP